MFAQVIRGRTKNAAGIKAASDRWQADIKPGAKGYLGVTAGITDDGRTFTIVRFESQEAAEANGARTEQTAWWENEMSKNFDGAPEFFNCPNVELMRDGGSNDAGFVQVMAYKTTDVPEVLALAKTFESMGEMRPDLIGGFTAATDDGNVFDVNYFTSEAEARKNETAEMPAEMQAAFEQFGKLVSGDVEYIDLRDPWLL